MMVMAPSAAYAVEFLFPVREVTIGDKRLIALGLKRRDVIRASHDADIWRLGPGGRPALALSAKHPTKQTRLRLMSRSFSGPTFGVAGFAHAGSLVLTSAHWSRAFLLGGLEGEK